MDTRLQGRLFATALCVIGASAFAGDGPGCRDRAVSADVEGGANGQISASDHAANAQKRFESMDANGDGKITASEIGASQGVERIVWAKNPTSSADKIKAFDRNKDGALSIREYADGSQAIFNALDTDGDGYVRSSEMELDAAQVSASDTR